MGNKIKAIKFESIAEEMGIEKGDCLLSINGEKVKDIIDYKFLISDEYIKVEIEKQSGEVWDLEIEKEYDEELGLEFEEPIIDKPKSCHNKCIFCFIDQMPKGMRDTLYFKDDDSRLAFLQGNFVTLTNMNDEDIDRIIKYRISPINVSVHTTNPDLRIKMINNKFAGNIYTLLKRLTQNGIKINCQIVLCPGINDGAEFKRTVEDLYRLYPGVTNAAVVPVGITKYRQNLFKLSRYDKNSASNQLKIAEELQRKYIEEIGVPFVRLSDEFYLVSETEIPNSDFYENYSQLEDGVGMVRLFRDNISSHLKSLNKGARGSFTFLTGELAYNEIKDAAEKIMENSPDIIIDVKKIINNFFGHTITVSGLITARDIMEQLEYKTLGKNIVIPECMLRKGYELSNSDKRVFLDDITLDELEKTLSRNILVCDYTGNDLIQIINENSEVE
ncbi:MULTISPECIES: DUF512 domain-containing protein [Clostridium]|uniref:Radical SAM superfamily protein n=1 Tax=Clostridium ragsdalei P11 TaxID=1353534 RepID=A0A1A6AXJ1_9CLOT|nr:MULTISPECIES: DUF512 domain-containing protein [Clostridium]OBR94796.1 radical SAM superfamily protein [Clostridium ragsdalei P11]QXE20491.1 Fe/S oxidoreductase [Clostridium sp. 001]